MPKARVLPEPVGARPQMSRPSSASVMVAAWMAKGSMMPRASSARVMESGTPSWAKVVDIGSPVPLGGGWIRVRVASTNERRSGFGLEWFTLTGRTSARLRTHRRGTSPEQSQCYRWMPVVLHNVTVGTLPGCQPGRGPPRPVGCWIVSGVGNRTENAEEPAPRGGFFAWAGLGVSVLPRPDRPIQTLRTPRASGPFRPGPTSNSTFWPSSRLR